MRLKLFKLWIKNVLLKYFLLFKYFEKYVFIQTIYSIDPFEVKRATSHKWQFDSGKYEWNVKVTDSKRKKEKYSTNITENKMNQEIKRGVRNLDKSQSQFLFGWDRDASSLFFFYSCIPSNLFSLLILLPFLHPWVFSRISDGLKQVK